MQINNQHNLNQRLNFGQVKVSKQAFDGFATRCVKEGFNVDSFFKKHAQNKNFDICISDDFKITVKANGKNELPFGLGSEAEIGEIDKRKNITNYHNPYVDHATKERVENRNYNVCHIISLSNPMNFYMPNILQTEKQDKLFIADKLVEIATAKLNYFREVFNI